MATTQLNGQAAKKNNKAISLVDGFAGTLDLNDGTLITAFTSVTGEDFIIPLGISHIHNAGNNEIGYGKDWRLSLNKKLVVSPSDTTNNTIYAFTDETGRESSLEEKYFYYLPNGTRQFVEKGLVEVKPNGELEYESSKVYVHQSCEGYTLIPEINDFKGTEKLEQRQEQQIELEDYIRQLESTVKCYIIVNSTNGETVCELSDLDKTHYDGFIRIPEESQSAILVTKRESLKLRSFYLQYEKTEDEAEKALYAAQIAELISGAKSNLPAVKETFKKYFSKSAELEFLIRQTPVNYLRDESGIINGFNKNGNLVLIADSYGNYVSIEYGSGDRIANIYDSNKKLAKFEYRNGLLQSITDNRGRKVEYAYDTSKRLTKVTYPDGKSCTITYTTDNRISTITSKYGYVNTFTYNGSKLSNVTAKKSNAIISEIVITYGTDNSVTLTTEKNESETYKFDSEKRLIRYTTRDELNRQKTQTYSYSNGGNRVTFVTTDCLGPDPLTIIYDYDDFGLLITETVDTREIVQDTEEQKIISYCYNSDNRLVKKTTVISSTTYYYSDEDDTYSTSESTYTEEYRYDMYGNLIMTESYEGDRNDSSEIKFEERVYNNDGNMVKCIRWSSLDSSSKFYEECEREKDGRIKYAKDETGAYSAMYEYRDGTNEVSSVTYANGCKVAYGRDPYTDELTYVTASTAEGEPNTNNIVYKNGLPVKVNGGNTTINYSYDDKGRKTKAGNVTFTYDDTRGYNSDKSRYSLGAVTQSRSTADGNISIKTERYGTGISNNGLYLNEAVTINDSFIYSTKYNGKGQLTRKEYKDENNNTRYYSYSYDSYDRLKYVENRVSGSATNILREDYEFDEKSDVMLRKTLTGEVNQTYYYSYRGFQPVLKKVIFGKLEFHSLNDGLDRYTGKEIYDGTNKVAGEYITYRKVGDHATNMPARIKFASGSQLTDSLQYKYDSCGNICEIRQNGELKVKYTYDSFNRLIKEENTYLSKTVEYEYDISGNILRKKDNGATINYDYVGDALVSYDGNACVYEFGKPTTYKSNALEWQYGKWLTKYGNTTFAYDSLGRRVKKGSITFTYDSDGRLIKQSNGFEFIYDANGVIGFKYSNTFYFYRRDAQGNIIAILNSSGVVVSTYTYDAWGYNKVGGSNTSLGNLNPFRYRGYYYDKETGLYYLQTRYYDPEVGRFISLDSVDYADPETINGLNLYAYCLNNPIMGYDPNGCKWSPWGEVKDFFTNLYKGIVEPISDWIDQLNELIDKHIIKPITDWENSTIKSTAFKAFVDAWTWLNGDEWYQSAVKNIITVVSSTLIGYALGGPFGGKIGAFIGVSSSFFVGVWWDSMNNIWDRYFYKGIFN